MSQDKVFEEVRSDVAEMVRKMDALTIIFTSPQWPARSKLTDAGKALWDKLSEGEHGSYLKQYCLDIVDCNFTAAIEKATAWTPLLNAFMDDPAAIGTEERVMMLAVYKHYVDAIGVDFTKLQD